MTRAAIKAIRGLAMLLLGLAAIGLWPTPPAFGEGTKSIAAAPVVNYDELEHGSTANGLKAGAVPAPGETCGQWADYNMWSFWTLPVTVGDLITIDWEALFGDTNFMAFPVGTSDYNVSSTEPVVCSFIASNNKQETVFTATASGNMPLMFSGPAECCGHPTPPGPYAFTAYVKHAMSINAPRVEKLSATGTFTATASLETGSPVPDGLMFTLAASLGRTHATFTATSTDGAISFHLDLPAWSYGKKVALLVTHAEDAAFLAAESQVQHIMVDAPPPSPPPCVVPKLKGHLRRIATVKRLIREAHCAVGTVKHVHRHQPRRGLVAGLDPHPGSHLANNAPVAIIVSSGPLRRHQRRHIQHRHARLDHNAGTAMRRTTQEHSGTLPRSEYRP